MRHHKWWRVRARPIIVEALRDHLSQHEAKRAADRILDGLEDKGLQIVRHHATANESYTAIGTGLFRLPGERRAWRIAELRARETLDSIEQDQGMDCD